MSHDNNRWWRVNQIWLIRPWQHIQKWYPHLRSHSWIWGTSPRSNSHVSILFTSSINTIRYTAFVEYRISIFQSCLDVFDDTELFLFSFLFGFFLLWLIFSRVEVGKLLEELILIWITWNCLKQFGILLYSVVSSRSQIQILSDFMKFFDNQWDFQPLLWIALHFWGLSQSVFDLILPSLKRFIFLLWSYLGFDKKIMMKSVPVFFFGWGGVDSRQNFSCSNEEHG